MRLLPHALLLSKRIKDLQSAKMDAAHGAQGMSDSYAAYKEHLISQVGTLQRGVELSVTSSSERQQQHAPHSMAASMKAHNGAAERSAAFASIILQWLAVFLLCILLYGWWHFSDSPWKAMLCEVLERMVSVKWPEQPII